MVTVPKYQPGQAGAAPLQGGFQNFRVPAGAFGSDGSAMRGLSDALRGHADTLGDMALQEAREKAERARREALEDIDREAKKADASFSKQMRAVTYGDGQTQGFYDLIGEDALRDYEPMQRTLHDLMARSAGQITDGRARAIFERTAARRLDYELNAMTRHVLIQRLSANDSASRERIGEARKDAAVSYNDPQRILSSLGVVLDETAQIAERNTWTPEATQSALHKAESDVHRSVVSAMLTHDAAGAVDYFGRNRDRIETAAHEALLPVLRGETVRQAARTIADDILSRGLSESESLQLASDTLMGGAADGALGRETARLDTAQAVIGQAGGAADGARAHWDRARSDRDAAATMVESAEADLAHAEAAQARGGPDSGALDRAVARALDNLDRARAARDQAEQALDEADRALERAPTGGPPDAERRGAKDALHTDVNRRIRTHHADKRTADADRRRRLKLAAWEEVETSHATDGLTPEVRAELDGEMLAQMDRRARMLKARREPSTDWDLYHTLMSKTPRELAATDLEDHRNSLSDMDYAALHRRKARDRDMLATGDTDTEMSEIVFGRQISAAMEEIGLIRDRNAKKRGLFQRIVRQVADEESRAKGRSLTYSERQTIIDQLMVEVAVGALPRNDERHPYDAFGTTEGDRLPIDDIEDVPWKDRLAIAVALQEENREPTDEAIRQVYAGRLIRQGGQGMS